MKIECPGCKLSGNIDDERVPATGLAMICPRCKKPFTVERPALTPGAAAAMLDSCPKCQYATFSEEKFSVCPKCGLVVGDYHKEKLATRQNQNGRAASVPPAQRQPSGHSAAPLPRFSQEQLQKDEVARRKHGLNKVPGSIEVVEEPVPARSTVETPLPVMIAGWGTVFVAVILIGFGVSGIMEYLAKLAEAKAAIAAFEEVPSESALFMQYLVFPALSILFSLVMIVFASQFLMLKKWSNAALHKGALTGAGLFALMKLSDMFFWFKRASAAAPLGYYAMGLFGEGLLMLIYIAPFLVLAEYLKSSLFEKTEELFF